MKKKDVFIYVDPKSNLILPESIVCAIQKKPNFFEKYINGPDSTLPFEVFKKLGLCDYLLDSIINDFILHNIWKQQYKTTYLTNRPIDTLIIDNLSINKKTFNPLNYIEPVLPLVEGADIENLLKIRDNDYDSFLVYRDKLRELIDNKNYKTKEECQEAYNDLIIPEINKMNNIINKNKKHLKRKIGIDFALSGIVCSLGYYKGFSFDSIVGLLPLLGFSTGIHDINEFNSTELIEDNELYFLWKVNQKKIER